MASKHLSLIVKLDLSPASDSEVENANHTKQLFHGINIYEFDNNGQKYSQFQADMLQQFVKSTNDTAGTQGEIRSLITSNGQKLSYSFLSVDLEDHRRQKEEAIRAQRDPAHQQPKSQNDNDAKVVNLQMIMISKDIRDDDSQQNLLFILQNQILMKLGVSYLAENLHQLINNNVNPMMPNAQSILNGTNSAFRSCIQPLFDQIYQSKSNKTQRQRLGLIQKTNYKQILSNYKSDQLAGAKKFIEAILTKFSNIKVFGAGDDGEVDSLEHVALFDGDQLLACSKSWHQTIHQVDKTLLHIQLMIYRQSESTEKKEQSVFLTHTGIVNEAGVAMENTIGKFAYNFVCIPMENDKTLTLLCSDSLQIEEVNDFVQFWVSQNGFLDDIQENPQINDSQGCIQDWLLINNVDKSIRSHSLDGKSKIYDILHLFNEQNKNKIEQISYKISNMVRYYSQNEDTELYCLYARSLDFDSQICQTQEFYAVLKSEFGLGTAQIKYMTD